MSPKSFFDSGRVKILINGAIMKKLALVFAILIFAGSLRAGNCDLSGYATYSQGGWIGSSNSSQAALLAANFETVFPNGVIVSGPNGSLTFTSAQAVWDWSTGGGSSILTQSYVNPTNKLGNFASQIVAMTINVAMDAAGITRTNPVPLGDLIFEDGDFEDMTVNEFLAFAQSALFGGPLNGYSISDITGGADDVNLNFHEGNTNAGDLTCDEVRVASIGNKVWEDSNGNGIQDNGERGLQDVVVRLLDCDNHLLSTTTTNADGEYSFTGLESDDYRIQFVAPDGYSFAIKDAGQNNQVDSDADRNTGKTSCTELSEGENDLSWDAGFVPNQASIGNFVWNDANSNGIQDNGESGVEGVRVELFNGMNQLQGTTTTAANGSYLFDNLTPGDYKLKFTLPENYVFTTQNAGNDDALDSDAHPSTGYTAVTTLVPGENDMSWDAGIVFVAPALKASIGNKVWNDANINGIQDNGESGVENVVVELFTCDNNFLAMTATDASGIYGFIDIVPGEYKLKFTLPLGYSFTSQNSGDDALDSDVSPATGYTVCTVLDPGETDNSWDAGIFLTPVGEVDIQVVKTASSLNVQDGATVTFTITATNIGNSEATNVRVGDLLPASLVFVSATQANYDEITGVWTIGTLAAGTSAVLQITTTVDVDFANAALVDFGVASPYNVFVFDSLSQPSSDTEGKMAVGGNVYLSNYSVGDKIVHGNQYEDVLIVGGYLNFVTGRIYGNVIYGDSVSVNPNHVDGDISKADPIDFEAAETHLNSVSMQLAGLIENGSVTVSEGQLNLIGTDPIINVFNPQAADFNSTHTKIISAPNGSVVIVNIPGDNLIWAGGLQVLGTSRQQVIFNFFEAENIQISNIAVEGSILAPKAHVHFISGQQNGQMIAKSVEGQAQFNNSLFVGNIPVDQGVTNTASLINVDQDDVDAANNSSSVNITVFSNDPGNGNGNGNGQNNNWQLVGDFDAGEMVWCMTYDINGNNYIGTVGGKVYRINQNNERILINEGMNVSWIWDIRVEDDGKVFIGTELGLFRSNNAQTSWTQRLAGTDVRALAKISNKLYIGTWGSGVFRYNFATDTAVPVNDGLGTLAVHALTADSQGNLYAGTMGGGVYKFEPNSWTQLSVGYDFIWALDVTSDDKLIAVTYGGGVYASFDLGNTWQNLNAGLNAPFVYSISVDESDNVYVSTWAGGVYMINFTNKTFNWQPYGMGGFSVNSMMFNSNEGMIYAGTREGKLFKQDLVTGLVTEITEIPTEFELAQNYPNPFNPTTRIQFSIPADGIYSLTIYNILGQEVRVLANDQFTPGTYTFTFDASGLSSGVYIYRFAGKNVSITKKMMLLK